MMKKRRLPRHGGELTLSWRIWLPHWEKDEAFDRMVHLMKGHLPIVDEVALFDTITHHLYIPLDEYGKRMQRAAQCMDAFRRAGVRSVGVNVLCTIGHINEGWSYMPPLPFQPMMGHDGSVSTGCACPNTPEMRDYIRAKYALVAGARPDFVWVDDDIRMHHHGVAWGCFCPTCLALFAQKAGKAYAREELVKAFDDPAQGRLRELWVEQNAVTIESLLGDVAAAVHKVDPSIATGLMTAGAAWTTYSGMAFDRWFPALGATKARPGGGFYCDSTPIEMYRKALDCGRQRATLPPAVTDVQYELENFPYQRLKKSATAVVNECTLALACGLNGVAFDMLALSRDDFLPLLESVPPARPVWEKWTSRTAGLPTRGLWPAWSNKLMARRAIRQDERWLGWQPQYNITLPETLGDIGLPVASDAPACGTVLCGRVAEAFSDEELSNMLSGGVLMDSTALQILTERRLGHLTGVRLVRQLDNGVMERFTQDKLNGGAAAQLRDARIEFWGNAKGMGDVLEPVSNGVRVLTTIEDYFYRVQGPGMTAFQNSLGGRVVVMGYAPWIFLHSVSKRLQLQNVADWISRGRMPLRIDQTVPLVSVVRQSKNRRRGGVVLLNAGMDTIGEATVHLRTAARHIRLLTIGRRDRVLKAQPETSGLRITLRDIPPWALRIILMEEGT